MPKTKNSSSSRKKKTHTLIISDLHLGSSVCQAEKALKLLKSYSFRKLILLGDVLDSVDFRDLPQEHWEFLTHIGKLSKTKKIRWVVGNHDAGLVEIFRSLMDAQIHEIYNWQYKGKKYLAIHGHQFDRFLVNNKLISDMATAIYNYVQKIDYEDRRVSHYLKQKSKGWLRLSDKVARGALRFAKKYDANYVFCGHTHKATQRRDHGIKYYNSGCWTDNPCTYITIDEKKIEICDY